MLTKIKITEVSTLLIFYVFPYFSFLLILPEYTPPLGDIKSFENEWLEVEIKNPDIAQTEVHDVGIPKFLCDNIDLSVTDGPLYKQTHLEVDVGQKSDRIEWGHARYQTIMQPGSSFELVVQWITASGAIVYDLVIQFS